MKKKQINRFIFKLLERLDYKNDRAVDAEILRLNLVAQTYIYADGAELMERAHTPARLRQYIQENKDRYRAPQFTRIDSIIRYQYFGYNSEDEYKKAQNREAKIKHYNRPNEYDGYEYAYNANPLYFLGLSQIIKRRINK